jgi:glycosyltransferase involved in cell wall biosynthesis
MRLAIIVSHPIQYYSPWFRHVAAAMGCAPGDEWRVTSDEFERRSDNAGPDPLHATSNSQQNALRVFYLWDFGVTEKTDKGFGKAVKWDVDLLEGYDHEFVPNVSRRPGTDWFGGLDNPELLQRVKAFAPDAVLQFGYNYKSLVNFDLRWNTKRAPLLFRGDSHLLGESVEHGAWSMELKKWVRSVGLRLLFRRFACFLAVGKANAGYFRAHGVPESKIVRCPHVVDNAFFLERKNASMEHEAGRHTERGLRGELGIPDGELVFLFAGKLEEKKQPMELLEAFLAADLPKATLLFVGSGALEGALKEKASHSRVFETAEGKLTRIKGRISPGGCADRTGQECSSPETPGFRGESSEGEIAAQESHSRPQGDRQLEELSEAAKLTRITEDLFRAGDTGAKSCPQEEAANSPRNVVFLEFQNQSRMPDVYRTGDVLVLPSRGRYETWGLAVNEAACCGLPAIVSSHVGCGPDLIEDGVTGWIFEAGNTEELRKCLCEAASNRHRLGQIGSTLQRAVLSDFSYESATRALLGVVARRSYRAHAR